MKKNILLTLQGIVLAIFVGLSFSTVSSAQTTPEGVLSIMPGPDMPANMEYYINDQKVDIEAVKAISGKPLRAMFAGKWSDVPAMYIYTTDFQGKIKVKNSKWAPKEDELALDKYQIGVGASKITYVYDGKIYKEGQPKPNFAKLYRVAYLKGADAVKKYGQSVAGGVVIDYQTK